MVKIITDTTACLFPETVQKYQIPVIPQIINFGTESFMEGIDIDIPTFMQRLATCRELPKTAAPKPELFIKEFERLVPLGEPIVCIHPSSEVSGTVRSALVAAAEFPSADIHIIDTRLIAGPLATLVELAAEYAAAGADVETVVSLVTSMAARCRIYFLVDTLEYLARGGRIGGASAFLGSVLQIKPILTFEEGRVNQFEKARTSRQALKRLKELVINQVGEKTPDGKCRARESAYITINQANTYERASQLANELQQELSVEHIPIFEMPPAIITHGGPGVLAVGFFV